METEEIRIPRKKPTHKDVDTLLPVNKKKVMANDVARNGASCFSHLWNMETKDCGSCHDNEMCGIMFASRLKRKVKEFEAEKPPMLDVIDFDGITRKSIMMWLRTQERTGKEFIDHVEVLSKCPDRETVKMWCKSFIKDSDRLYVQDGVIRFK